jgi:hypothetical protein
MFQPTEEMLVGQLIFCVSASGMKVTWHAISLQHGKDHRSKMNEENGEKLF